ncbi:MAG: HAD-IA family hydrolase [Burkholderiales bacterium]|nr:HAD-IA family hydrolase [Burkholderiales bacterium]
MPDFAPRRYDLIVFDWDGTLSDSTALIAASIRAACDDVGQPMPSERHARYVIGLGLADALAHVAPALAADGRRALAERYRHHFLAREHDVPLFDGAAALLAGLEDAGYRLAVATGKSRAGLDRALARHGLERRFHATRCADEGYPKPHPDMLLTLMDRLAAEPSRTLMIGDTTHDLDLARNAGTQALAVAWGAHDPEGLALRGPLATVHSVGELAAWLADNG